METNTVKPVPVKLLEPYNREEFIHILEMEGMIRVLPSSEINDKSILAAAYNVVKNLRSQRTHITGQLNNERKALDNFYHACQKANILVSRNNDNEIVLSQGNFYQASKNSKDSEKINVFAKIKKRILLLIR